jgi:hypothetical protein
MKTKADKKFDSVKMMREIRDRISKDTETMNFEEFKKYMDRKIQSKKKDTGE